MLRDAGLPAELAESVDMRLISPDGQPNGILMDIDALQQSEQREALSLVNPLSISRVQSAYVPSEALSNTLVVTFTVTNNRPPSLFSHMPSTATVTETISATLAFDPF